MTCRYAHAVLGCKPSAVSSAARTKNQGPGLAPACSSHTGPTSEPHTPDMLLAPPGMLLACLAPNSPFHSQPNHHQTHGKPSDPFCYTDQAPLPTAVSRGCAYGCEPWTQNSFRRRCCLPHHCIPTVSRDGDIQCSLMNSC